MAELVEKEQPGQQEDDTERSIMTEKTSSEVAVQEESRADEPGRQQVPQREDAFVPRPRPPPRWARPVPAPTRTLRQRNTTTGSGMLASIEKLSKTYNEAVSRKDDGLL